MIGIRWPGARLLTIQLAPLWPEPHRSISLLFSAKNEERLSGHGLHAKDARHLRGVFRCVLYGPADCHRPFPASPRRDLPPVDVVNVLSGS